MLEGGELGEIDRWGAGPGAERQSHAVEGLLDVILCIVRCRDLGGTAMVASS